MCVLWEEERSSSTSRTCYRGLQKASWAGWYPTGRGDQAELPCTSPRAGSHRKFYFLVNAHRAVPCVDVIPLLISPAAFTENPYELTRKECLEGGRADLMSLGGRRVYKFTGELSLCAVEGRAGCACAAPSWNQLLFPGTATSL